MEAKRTHDEDLTLVEYIKDKMDREAASHLSDELLNRGWEAWQRDR